MSKHYMKECWLHLVWITKYRNPLLLDGKIASKVATKLKDICFRNDINCEAVYVNSEHVHLLIELPVDMTISDLVHLLKGSTSHFINETGLLKQLFRWARGYAAFSVSKENVDKVTTYILNQKKHHSN